MARGVREAQTVMDNPAPFENGELVQICDLVKVYGEGDAQITVLRQIDMTVQSGEIVALCGPSGSGKSTLLNIIGCLDRPTAGSYHLAGRDVSQLDRTTQAEVRLTYLGFIFQSFHLLGDATALENVTLPLQYAGFNKKERTERARAMLERVGLGDRIEHRPNQLSGGQRQRVAIARACVTRPRLLLADEPTGALDTRTGRAVLELLGQLHAESGLGIILVTHDPDVAAWAHRRVDLLDGRIVDGPAAAAAGSSTR